MSSPSLLTKGHTPVVEAIMIWYTTFEFLVRISQQSHRGTRSQTKHLGKRILLPLCLCYRR